MEKHFIETIIIFSKSRFHDGVYMQIIACYMRFLYTERLYEVRYLYLIYIEC